MASDIFAYFYLHVKSWKTESARLYAILRSFMCTFFACANLKCTLYHRERTISSITSYDCLFNYFISCFFIIMGNLHDFRWTYSWKARFFMNLGIYFRILKWWEVFLIDLRKHFFSGGRIGDQLSSSRICIRLKSCKLPIVISF
jgi:hypothetical protein